MSKNKQKTDDQVEKPWMSIVISSKKVGSELEAVVKRYRDTMTCKNVNTKVFLFNNDGSLGLTKLYGEFLKNGSIPGSIMIFCHDDLTFLREGWDDEVYRLFKDNPEYGIIGVAGSAEFDERGAWWMYKDIYGVVLHPNGLTRFSPLLKKDLEEVCVIDGLFMAVNREKISKNFDPDIEGFHFYDIDFCLANYLDGKSKIGVTTNIRIKHDSEGSSALSESWARNRQQVALKYKEFFPIKVKKKNGK